LLFEYHDGPRETKKKNLDEFVHEMERKQTPRLEVAGRRVVDTLEKMTEIFLPKDRLLGSAGVFPVYFWIVRNENEKDYHRIREFLVNFEADRRQNRQLIAQDPTSRKIDPELTQYDRYNRSPDDPESYRVRYDILKKRFKQVTTRRS